MKYLYHQKLKLCLAQDMLCLLNGSQLISAIEGNTWCLFLYKSKSL